MVPIGQKGCLFTFQNKKNYKIIDVIKDGNGRVILLKININDKTFAIVNTYMPTSTYYREQLEVISFIKDKLYEINCENILIGGDLNIHLNDKLDIGNTSNISNKKVKEKLLELMDYYSLTDIFRIKN